MPQQTLILKINNKLSIPKVKIILLGDSGVGKTSLITAIKGQQPSIQHQPTVGIDFFSKNMKSCQNIQFKVHFWDTAGQQRFRCIIPSYIRNSQIGIIIYDVTRRKSFQNVLSWLQLYKDYAFKQNSNILIVGNKIDLRDHAISSDQAKLKTLLLGFPHIQVSAKQLKGIKQIEEKIQQMLGKFNIEKLQKTQKNIEIQAITKKQKQQQTTPGSPGLSIKLLFQKTDNLKYYKCCQ